jgi:hypothetical protein
VADIQKSIRLFNEALPLAWAKLEGLSANELRRVGARLSELVRTSVRAGLEDPASIAAAAVEAALHPTGGKTGV